MSARLRLARRVNRIAGWLIRHAPERINFWLHEPSIWYPRWGRWAGATVCRALGHDWNLLVADRPEMFMCDGCGWVWHADDPDAHDPDSRDGRDAALAVMRVRAPEAVRYLPGSSVELDTLAPGEEVGAVVPYGWAVYRRAVA